VQQGDTKQIAVGSKGVAESISVNGARPDQISYNLDGGNNEDLMSNTNNPFPFPTPSRNLACRPTASMPVTAQRRCCP